ncbi:EthD family reductase [Shinella zoogloeoides]|uniref:EthD family reductase n=1 Tax=Shinella zoogloeoides TaxID=352475 RepID=UPI000E6598FC|nr:EthD family reductase [Shinella zoogloeoides]
MFKAAILLKRKEGVSAEEFADWWLNRHAPLARDLPKVRRVVFNLVKDGPYDGISELWFDSEEALQQAYASDHGKAVAADTLSMVAERIRLPVSEHVIKEMTP